MHTKQRSTRFKWRSLVAMAATATLLLTGCSVGAATTAVAKHDLVIARAMDLTTLDPDRGYCDTCQIVFTALYDRLVIVSPEDSKTLQPGLASTFTANADNTQFTFGLDPAATFSDASPVEPKDVKWSLERLANIKGSASYLLAGMTSIDTPDAKTVVVNFAAPNSAFLAIVAASYLGIVNSDVASEHGASAAADASTADTAEDWFLSNSAGSGPYILDSYTANSAVKLTANPNYWRTKPTFDTVTLKEVTDSSSQLQQLQQGDVDIAMQISPDALDQLKNSPTVTTAAVDSFNYTYIALMPGAEGGAPLADVRVREAIRDAIDYDNIVKTLVAGYGKLQGSPIPNGFEGSEKVALPSYDVTKAKALLAEAGYPDGFTISSTYPKIVAYGVDLDLQMQAIQQNLASVGITLELTPVDFSQWADVIGGKGTPITAVYFAPDHTDSSQYVQYFGLIPNGGYVANFASLAGKTVNQAEVDGLTTALAQTGAERTASYQSLAQLMADDVNILPIVNPQLIMAHASDITGVTYSPCCNVDLGALGLTK
ncbi:ABC transporter substrate-binding protein [Cryobacterium algoricola]|uniref:ABC transporter substrate-binding protein n=1 Tax=Cryobacterium algoricola TaxID=1259183 RepID=A0ABY2I9A4_9MICO|nr:ABC transporter substrate-binding protein [Cryobacterium algoricola]TFB84162.1 ABC transporter substrate-binding protein [Cryobacterium algoricola]